MTAMYLEGLSALGGFGFGREALVRAAMASDREQAGRAADTGALVDYLPARAMRRMDHFTRMALLGAFTALADAELAPGGSDMDGLGIVFATGYGPAQLTFDFLDSIVDYGADMASPLAFSHSVHNIPAASIALHCGITGPVCTVCQFETSVTAGLLTARSWLREGRCQRVLFGAVDERTGVLDLCREKLTGTPPNRPSGDGAAFMVLSKRFSDRYGHIADVRLGESVVSLLDVTQMNLLSGRGIGPRLNEADKKGVETAVFADAYGILPVAQALDIILGTMMLSGSSPLNDIRLQTLSCLCADAHGAVGDVVLGQGGGNER